MEITNDVHISVYQHICQPLLHGVQDAHCFSTGMGCCEDLFSSVLVFDPFVSGGHGCFQMIKNSHIKMVRRGLNKVWKHKHRNFGSRSICLSCFGGYHQT